MGFRHTVLCLREAVVNASQLSAGEVQGRRRNQDAGDSTIIWGSGLCEFYLFAGILMVLLIFFLSP